jgi:hypothetical protein
MSNNPQSAGGPTRGESLGGVIGCLALVIALALLVVLTVRALWHQGVSVR